MASIKDVAKTAGVSVTTVSFVLNGKGNIPQKTREHVLKIVEELGYTRNINARNLREKVSRTIGYARPPYQLPVHPIMDKFLSEVVTQAEKRGWHVLLYLPKPNDPLSVYQELLNSQRVDGILLASVEPNDPRIQYLHERNFPFAMLGRTQTQLDQQISWVDIDGKDAIYNITQHLIQQNHTRIALIAPQSGLVADNRYEGYKTCLTHHNIPPDNTLLIRQGDGNSKDGYQAAKQLLTLKNPPTAIIALSDLLAYGALHYCTETNQNIAITGFDNDLLADVLNLTTVSQPTEKAAELLVTNLLQQITQKQNKPIQKLLKGNLIIRNSSLNKPH